ncbi:hypothetical protein J6590_003862 [Homalodisca vitripennis]|nr:hypothetical protein J6590_003862 [Homalodisca vitripennis]
MEHDESVSLIYVSLIGDREAIHWPQETKTDHLQALTGECSGHSARPQSGAVTRNPAQDLMTAQPWSLRMLFCLQ